jgi:exopolysaccharide biosynthesis polyprenyl glycosylphosphotransferase
MTAMDTGIRKIGEILAEGRAPSVRQGSPALPAQVMPGTAGKPGRSWSRKHLVLLRAVDLFFIAGAAGIAAATFPHPAVGYMSASAAVLWTLCLEAYRSRELNVLGAGFDEFNRVVTASLVTFGGLFMLGELLVPGIENSFYLLACSAGLGGILCGRLTLRGWLARQRAKGRSASRAVVVGEKDDVENVVGQIRAKSGGGYLVVGAAVVSADTSTALTVDGVRVPVVSDVGSFVPLVGAFAPDAVILAGPVPGGSDSVRHLAWTLERTGADLVLAGGLTGVAPNRIHVHRAGGLPLFHVQLPRYSGPKYAVKRILDVLLSGVGLVVLLPVFVILACLIVRDSSGPAVFRQERVGRGERTFTMYKFRSMVDTAESELAGLMVRNEGAGLLFKLRNDPRVTGLGRRLRRYSLDELPQLWNVFKGDMSLVGPRPPLPTEVAAYGNDVRRRLHVKPGLTGLWQVNGRSELSWKEGVRLDLYYVENWSLGGDLMIMLQTVKVLVKPHGAY